MAAAKQTMALNPKQHRAILAAAPLIPHLDDDNQRRSERYRLQDAAAECLPHTHRACACLRTRVQPQVAVVRTNEKTTLSGLVICGSAWVCPICGAKAAAKDAEAIANSVRTWLAGHGRVLLVTRTNPHLASSSAADIFKKHQAAERKFKSGRPWKTLAKRLGIRGAERALETPYGRNGWHMHIHELLFVAGNATAAEVQKAFDNRWNNVCVQAGIGEISREHGVHVDEIDSPISAEQVAKYLSKEVVGWSNKTSESGSLSALDMLRVLDCSTASDLAKEAARKLFRDYAAAIKGRRRIVPSGVARQLRKMTDEDEQPTLDLDETPEEKEPNVIAWLQKNAWSAVVKHRSRPDLLACASALDVVRAVARWLPNEEAAASVIVPDGTVTWSRAEGKFVLLPRQGATSSHSIVSGGSPPSKNPLDIASG